MQHCISAKTSVYFFDNEIKFVFLNAEKIFPKEHIDWAFFEHSRLWNYNMNYFDFLNQANITAEQGSFLIHDFIKKLPEMHTAIEPYPTTLRSINWVKFFTKYQMHDPGFDASLYAQYKILEENVEYHLLHNHLLDNAFSLYIGGKYFSDESMILKGKKILQKELEKQILTDGAHFERSPMYHQIMLEHLLDVINVMQNNYTENEKNFLQFLKAKAEKMLSWLEGVVFKNGDIPFVNDSAENVTSTTAELEKYAKSLGVFPLRVQLSDSGYRRWSIGNAEFFFDVGELSVSYQAGHAHADTFSFIVHVQGKPFIIDTGVSTYEKNERRFFERSTKAHNTVAYDDKNSSDVWDVFRTGDRAHIKILQEDENTIIAAHDGYKRQHVTHERKFEKHANEIILTDTLQGDVKHNAYFYLYFHENIKVTLANNCILSEWAEISFSGTEQIELLDCEIAHGFNMLAPSKVCRCTFINQMVTTMQIKH